MESIAKELPVSEWTIRTVVLRDIQYPSKRYEEGQFMSAKTSETISSV